tara:strand:+ start:9102 stop:9356 length:255 start_codon:yes stop_codon:yes gene_type:complete
MFSLWEINLASINTGFFDITKYSVGHLFSCAIPKINSKNGSESMVAKVGIVLMPKQAKITPQNKPEAMFQTDPRKIIIVCLKRG